MKYVNHMSSSVTDEKHEALIEKCGLAGYGAYWIIAETIAAQIRPESRATNLALTWRNWARHLRVNTKSTMFLVRSMSLVGLIFVHEGDEKITIDMPNLLKYADQYTRKVLTRSRHSPDNVRSDNELPALPALPDIKDLMATPPAEGSEAFAGAPKTSTPPRTKGSCYIVGCQNTGTVKINGKWYCRTCNPEYTR